MHKSPLSCNGSSCWKAASLLQSTSPCCGSKNHGMSNDTSNLACPRCPHSSLCKEDSERCPAGQSDVHKGGFGAGPQKLFASRKLLGAWQRCLITLTCVSCCILRTLLLVLSLSVDKTVYILLCTICFKRLHFCLFPNHLFKTK